MIYQPQQEVRTLKLSTNLKLIERANIKDISCMQIYENQLYIGTLQRVYVYRLAYRNHQIELVDQRSFYPHCANLHSIKASSTLLIVIPLKEHQLIRMWNRQKLIIVHGLKGHTKQISCLIFLSDKRHMATSSHDGTARIWNIEQPIQLQEQVCKYANIYPLLCLVQLEKDTIIFGGDDCYIIVWDWQKKLTRAKCFAHIGSINCLAICGFRTLYSIGGDSTIKIWRINENMNEGQFALQDNIEESIQLILLRQQQKKICDVIFKIEISTNQVIVIDLRGHAFMMNSNLQITQSMLRLEYTDQILNVKLWRNSLFLIVFQNGKGKLNRIVINLQEQAEQIIQLHTKSIFISDGTKNSIFVQSNESNMEIVDLP